VAVTAMTWEVRRQWGWGRGADSGNRWSRGKTLTSWTSVHRTSARADRNGAAEAGKIVLCEKPLAMNVAERKRMAEARAGAESGLVQLPPRAGGCPGKQLWTKPSRPAVSLWATYLQIGRDPANSESGDSAKQTRLGAMGDLLSHPSIWPCFLNGPISEVAACRNLCTRSRMDVPFGGWQRFANGSIEVLKQPASRPDVKPQLLEIHVRGGRFVSTRRDEPAGRLRWWRCRRNTGVTPCSDRSGHPYVSHSGRGTHCRVRAYLHRNTGRFPRVHGQDTAFHPNSMTRWKCRSCCRWSKIPPRASLGRVVSYGQIATAQQQVEE